MRLSAVWWIGLLLVCVVEAQAQVSVQPYEPGEGLVLTAPGGYDIRLSGAVQPMVEVKTYPQNPGSPSYTRFRMRRLITKMTGSLDKENLTYQVQVDLTGNSDAGGDGTTSNYLMDAWIAWKPKRSFEIVVGQDNTPTDGREMGMLSAALQFVERSPVSLAFSSIREFGVFVNTRYKLGGDFLLQPSLALTNGDGANVFAADHGGLKLGGRVDVLPFGSFARGGLYRQADMEFERTPKLVAGVFYSYNDGISDRRGRQSGTVLYLDSAGHESLPSYQKYGADLMAKYRGFTLYSEYVKATATVPGDIRQRVRTDGTLSPNFLVNGVQDITGYVKGRMMLGWGLNVQAGYLFRNGYSIDGRFSRLVPETNSFLRNATFYNRSQYYTLSVSKYLARNYAAKVQGSLTYIKAEDGTLTPLGAAILGKEFSAILMFTFAL